jgi:hypothetical protein
MNQTLVSICRPSFKFVKIGNRGYILMTDPKINQLILEELRELRSSFNDHAADTVQRLTALETQVSARNGGLPSQVAITCRTASFRAGSTFGSTPRSAKTSRRACTDLIVATETLWN